MEWAGTVRWSRSVSASAFPTAHDPSGRSVECCPCVVETCHGCRCEADAAVSARRRCDAGQSSVQPVHDGAERVVVEGGHLTGIDGAVRQHRVPSFPDRGRAHGDRVQPRRAAGLQKKPAGDIGMAGVHQGIEHERRAHESRGDVEGVAPGRVSRGDLPTACAARDRRRCRMRERARRRSARRRSCARRRHVRGEERRPRALGDRHVDVGHVVAAETAGRTRNEIDGAEQVGGRDDVGRGLGRSRSLRGRLRVEPVAELDVSFPQVPSSPTCGRMLSTQAFMLSNCRARSSSSPNRSASTVGTTVAASPQAAVGPTGKRSTSGRRTGRRHRACPARTRGR